MLEIDTNKFFAQFKKFSVTEEYEKFVSNI